MKIFISNLSFLVTEDDLDLIFKPFGEVGEIKILHEKQSELAAALIEMKNLSDAKEAVKVLNGIEIVGQTINLRFRKRDSDRRDDTDRRIDIPRRSKKVRRLILNRRIKFDTIKSEEKRADNDRRNIDERRLIIPRRTTENRRILKVRRAVA